MSLGSLCIIIFDLMSGERHCLTRFSEARAVPLGQRRVNEHAQFRHSFRLIQFQSLGKHLEK